MTDKDFDLFPSPCYIMEEELLRKNLTLIKSVADRAGVEIILAFKSFAMWRSFPIFREYVEHSTASSVYEARLALEEFGSRAHTYSPAYTEAGFPEIMRCSSHITFNSLAQFRRFYPMIQADGQGISCGIRVNPEYSEVETELYNPCAPGTRFGVMAEQLPDVLPQGIDGFHCHCHCESSSYELERTLEHLEAKFSRWFPQIKWLNLGGGHLMTRKDYDVEHLIRLLRGLKERYPHLRIILEPGSAFTWQTGVLASEVVDIVENRFVGMKSRGIYETPGGTILLAAHRDIETITVDREVQKVRDSLIPEYATLVYNGFWFAPEREAIQALVTKSQETVNGEVRLKLYKGNVMYAGRRSPQSLYSEEIATMEGGHEELYNQDDAEGFIHLNGLRLKQFSRVNKPYGH